MGANTTNTTPLSASVSHVDTLALQVGKRTSLRSKWNRRAENRQVTEEGKQMLNGENARFGKSSMRPFW